MSILTDIASSLAGKEKNLPSFIGSHLAVLVETDEVWYLASDNNEHWLLCDILHKYCSKTDEIIHCEHFSLSY